MLSPSTGSAADTYRAKGLQMQLTIVYSNIWGHSFSSGEMQYVVFAHHIAKTEAHIADIHLHEEDFSNPPPSNDGSNKAGAGTGHGGDLRMQRVRFGVHMFVHQTGLVARFSYSALLNYVITFSALSTLAWTIVELFLSFYPILATRKPRWYRQLNHDDEAPAIDDDDGQYELLPGGGKSSTKGSSAAAAVPGTGGVLSLLLGGSRRLRGAKSTRMKL
eukprot:g2220.t1